MDLIEIYIQEVTRRLPEKTRKDIAMELQSTIEDMLPDDYSEADVKNALSKLGDPVSLANKYRDKPAYLIGPAFFDKYVATLKMVLSISIIVILVLFFIGEFFSFSESNGTIPFIISIFGRAIETTVSIIVQVFFWVTLVFFILERTGVSPETMTTTGEKWKPEDLKSISFIPKKKIISKSEIFFSLLWTAIWATVYFNAMHTIGVYESSSGLEGLELVTPIFNQDVLLSYWPLVIIFIGIEIALAIFKWVSGHWTKNVAILNTIYLLISSIVFIVIITNPNILAPSFITYITEVFSLTTIEVNDAISKIINISIAIAIIASIISAIDGFRKARI